MGKHRSHVKTLLFSARFRLGIFLTLVGSLVFNCAAGAAAASWVFVTSPNTSPSLPNFLNAVSCSSATFCIAAGYSSTGTYDQTLIEEWNGTAWTIVPSPNTSSSANNELYGVSCTSTSFCMAGGYYYNGTAYQTLIEEWNGTAWSIVPSLNTSTTLNNELEAVSCASSTFCFTGGYSTGTADQTLTEMWDGSSWSMVPSADTSASQWNIINGLSCTTQSFCMAAGIYYDNTGDSQTLTEKWDGSAWTLIASPNTSTTQNNALYGVSCVGTSFCMSGDYYSNGTIFQTLTMEWSGSGWNTVSSPNSSTTQSNQLTAITCTTSASCTAVGMYTASSDQTLVEQWNGTIWSIVPSPNSSSSQNNDFYGVSCISPNFCAAVGTYYNGTTTQTLIEAPSEFVVAYATLQAGTLSFVSSPSNVTFSPVTLNGIDQVATSQEILDIGDNTGTGAGWSITLSNSPFVSGANSLANSAFTVASPAQPTCDTGATCSQAVWSGNVTYPYSLPGTTATRLLSVSTNTGMGDQTVTLNWSESIPSSSFTGTYQSTWTLTLVSGP